MTAAIALLFYVAGALFISLGRPFGPVALRAPTILAMVLCGSAALFFLSRQPITLQLTVQHPRRHLIAATVVLVAAAIWLSMIVHRFGPSAALFVLRGEVPPASVLQGVYRDRLPLRAVWPPMLLGSAVSCLLVADARRELRLIALAVVPLIGLVMIYETRYVLIWLVLYFLLHKGMHVKQLARLLTPRLLVPLVAGAIAFVLLGNIRSGVSFVQAKAFGEGMAVAPPYANLPLSGLWPLIYGFGNLARGMANDGNVHVLAFSLPAKALPGALQRLGMLTHEPRLAQRFADQEFGVDAWHTYALHFGVLGAFVLLLILLWAFHATLTRVRRRVRAGVVVSAATYALLLWISLRVALLPIGDYFLDFSALMELAALALMLRVAGAAVEPVRTA